MDLPIFDFADASSIEVLFLNSLKQPKKLLLHKLPSENLFVEEKKRKSILFFFPTNVLYSF